MRVSIITPTYNRADLLPETIDSVLGQDYRNLEYIVIDDGSMDDTGAVLARYADRIIVARHDNMGETATVNRGFSMATGDIVCVISSDDPILPGLISRVVEAFQANPDAAAVYPDWADIGPDSEFLRGIRLPNYDIRNIFETFSMGLGPGTFFRRSLLEHIKGRNPARIYCGDMEFWMLAAMRGRLVHIPRILATHRTHPGSASVGQRSARFASEWVDTWNTIASHPNLPADVAERRLKTMAIVHLIAARYYCGKDRIAAAVHVLKGVRLAIGDILRRRFVKPTNPESQESGLRTESAIGGSCSAEQQLKLVQISAVDLVGGQVNGFLTHRWLKENGYDSKMLVATKMSADVAVRSVGSRLRQWWGRLDSRLGTTALLPFFSRRLADDPWVRAADVVHLQLLHAGPSMSLLELPRLSREKRVLLSVHDMFFMTGHCVYAMDCQRWKNGCGRCPDLERPLRIPRDMTAWNWKLKRWIFDRSEVDIVVGSPWQDEQVRESPILGRFRRHMIPYGVDTRVFKPADKTEARRALGLPEDVHVIAFRNSHFPGNYKGGAYITEALHRFEPRRPTVLLIFEAQGGMDDLRKKYRFHEMGWVIDSAKIAVGLQAADIFLMPSTAEAFGLMAVESMACGTPVIVFDGTALPDTIGGPECGAIVPQGDSAGLARAIGDCLDSPERLERYRINGLRHVHAKHRFEVYADRYLQLYSQLAEEGRT